MKWTIYELKKLSRSNSYFEEQLDLSSYIQDIDDILEISPVQIKGNFQLLDNDSLYLFDCEINCHLIMPCAITLNEVDVPISFQTTLKFAKQINDDNTYQIEGITIDLDPVVFAEIMIEKPMRVVDLNAEEFSTETVELDEDESSSNPFSILKNHKF